MATQHPTAQRDAGWGYLPACGGESTISLAVFFLHGHDNCRNATRNAAFEVPKSRAINREKRTTSLHRSLTARVVSNVHGKLFSERHTCGKVRNVTAQRWLQLTAKVFALNEVADP